MLCVFCNGDFSLIWRLCHELSKISSQHGWEQYQYTFNDISYTNTHRLYWTMYFTFQFFISALSFATFAVSPELPQNRLQLSFTLLLTSVAFKFVINQSLPKISYLTYMVSLISVQWASMTRVELLLMLLFAWFIHRFILVQWNFVCGDTCMLKPLMLHLHSMAFMDFFFRNDHFAVCPCANQVLPQMETYCAIPFKYNKNVMVQ